MNQPQTFRSGHCVLGRAINLHNDRSTHDAAMDAPIAQGLVFLAGAAGFALLFGGLLA
jgi:hypothetical protein